MIDPLRSRRILGMTVFGLIALAFLLLRLLPLSPGATPWPGPDLMLCLTFVWLLRRPDQMPALLIAAVFLIEDIILLRPFGLWTAIIVIGAEFARSHDIRWRDQPFLLEWLRVATLFAVLVLAHRFVMALAFVPLPSLGQVILRLLATVFCYPLVVLAARWLLGLKRLDIAEAEMMRHR